MTSETHIKALEMADELEKQSFRNLVDFYSDELKEIINGRPYTQILKKKDVLKLSRYGILVGRPKSKQVSAKALNVLIPST